MRPSPQAPASANRGEGNQTQQPTPGRRATGQRPTLQHGRDGDLGVLIRNSKGVVLANSTVGLNAVRAGVPTVALGEAVYDIAGITHQGGLDSFWTKPEPVDAKLERQLVRAMAAEIQVRGSFYDKAGQKLAIGEIVDRLTRRPYPAWARNPVSVS